MRRLGITLFVAVSLICLALLRTDGFFLSLIEAPLFPGFSDPLPAGIEKVLSQPFHYLDKGRQCFVFESEDGKYVLKFFNQKYLRMPWYAALPFIHAKEERKRAQRQNFYLHSYEIAFREFGEEILYLHLSPSANELPVIYATNKGAYRYEIDLNQLPFVLQKKGIPLYTGLTAIYKEEGLTGLCREIDEFVNAIALRIGKKIADADQDVEHNWGFVNGKLFHLDPGRLYYDESLSDPTSLKTEWWRATHNFRDLLELIDIESAVYLDEKLK